MDKVIVVLGTRPEAIKLVPVVQKLKQEEKFQTRVVTTAQHRELLDGVLELFNLKPDYDLDIMSVGQSLTEVTINILAGLKEVLSDEGPDLVLVHGDTTTTLAASLAAFYQRLPLAHLEAGLRSYRKYQPYPEEINRRLTSTLADLHFAPTKENYQNLLAEGVAREEIFITGNTVIDTAQATFLKDYQFNNQRLANISLQDDKVILVTAHRRENFGQPLENICRALKDLAASDSDLRIIFPVHPNPKVKEVVYAKLAQQPQISLLEPLDYQDFINLVARSYLILTDSGGLQEEAPAFNKPVLVLRKRTERQAGLKRGTLQLVGTAREEIVNRVQAILIDKAEYQKMAEAKNPYGDGRASRRVVDYLKYYFSLTSGAPHQFIE